MTRRGYVALALAAVVLLVVPLGLVPFVLRAVPGQSGASDPAVAADVSCDEGADPADGVPTDVVAARMCAVDNRVASWFGPQDVLRTGLEPLVDLLGGLELLPESTEENPVFCTSDGGIAFDLRLALASGEVVSIQGDTGGCSTVQFGGDELSGSDGVVAAFMDAVAEQRRTSEPAEIVDLPIDCGQGDPDRDHRLSVIGDPRDLVRAVTCWRPNADEVGPWQDVRPVPPRLLARLVDDIATHSETQDQFGEPDCPGGLDGYYWQDLVGQTRWGDVVALRGVCREFMTSSGRYWHPSPTAQRILDRLRR